MCRNSAKDFASLPIWSSRWRLKLRRWCWPEWTGITVVSAHRKQWVATQLVRRLADPHPSDEDDDSMSGPEAEADWAQGQGALPVGGGRDAGGGEVTLTADARRDAATDAHPVPGRRSRADAATSGDDRPVEFWPTVVDPGGAGDRRPDGLAAHRRRHQARPVRPDRPPGRGSAGDGTAVRRFEGMAEVLTRTRDNLEANERAEVARHMRHAARAAPDSSQQEFASRIGVPADEFAALPRRHDQPAGVADDPDAAAVRPVRQDERPPRRRRSLSAQRELIGDTSSTSQRPPSLVSVTRSASTAASGGWPGAFWVPRMTTATLAASRADGLDTRRDRAGLSRDVLAGQILCHSGEFVLVRVGALRRHQSAARSIDVVGLCGVNVAVASATLLAMPTTSSLSPCRCAVRHGPAGCSRRPPRPPARPWPARRPPAAARARRRRCRPSRRRGGTARR